MIPDDLVEILRCPVTRQRLTVATDAQLARLNSQRPEPLGAALVRADGAVAYPVCDGIPLLLVGEAIAIS